MMWLYVVASVFWWLVTVDGVVVTISADGEDVFYGLVMVLITSLTATLLTVGAWS